MTTSTRIPQLLETVRHGDPAALDDLTRAIRDVLTGLLESSIGIGAVNPQRLVGDAYRELFPFEARTPANEAHFGGAAARIVREVLSPRPIPMDFDDLRVSPAVLGEALERLYEQRYNRARIAELRLFGGLSLREIAKIRGVASAKVGEEWRRAKIWLAREISSTP